MVWKNQGRRDLRLQLLALYLLFVGLTFALTLFFYINAGQRLRADVAAADLSLARAIALETETVLLKAKEASEAFAAMPAVVQGDSKGMETIFVAGAAARQDIDFIYRLAPDGRMYYHYPTTPDSTVGHDFSARDDFQMARHTQEHVFSRGRVSPTTGQPVVTSMMPVFAADRFAGTVAIDLDLQRLAEMIKRIGLKQPTQREIDIMIVDGGGQVIAYSTPNKLWADLPALPSGVDKPALSEVLSGREGWLITKDPWQVKWLYTYTPIPITGWGVIVQHPARLAFASLDNIQSGLVVALALFSLGAFLFWHILSRWVITPLETLTRYTEGLGQQTVEAELNREVILPLSSRQDQLGRLTRASLRAERYIRSRLMELTTLNKTSATVAASLDTQQVIDTILNAVQRLLQVRQCALLVINERTQRLEIRASRGLSQGYVTHLDLTGTSRQLPAHRAIASGRPVQVPDVETDESMASVRPAIRAEGYRSLLVIPLTTPHVPRAVLSIYHPDVHHFSEREIDLAAGFANHAALALEHAMLFSLTDAELQKRVLFLSALNRVARTVSQSLLIEEVLNHAMDAVLEVMKGDACWIYLQRPGEDFLRLRAQRGLSERLAKALGASGVVYGEGLIGEVAQQGQSLLLDEGQMTTCEWAGDPIIAHSPWQTLALAPLSAKSATIGVLGVAGQTDHAFSDAETGLLQAISDQLAIAVVNARLYRRSREAAILEERNRVAREIHDTLAQGFTGILIQLQAAERLNLKRPDKARQSLQEAQDLARESLKEARRSVLNLRPTILENLALDKAMARQVARFENDHRLQASFVLAGYPSPLNPEIEQNLYRITQEALTNISRHAQANKITVALEFAPKTVTLTITDDGIGLNGYAIPGRQGEGATAKLGRGFGLVSIQERASLMYGKVSFTTPPTGGTQIEVVIPK